MSAVDGVDGQVVLVGANFHSRGSTRPSRTFEASRDGSAYPRNVTLGFRQNFWRVFSRVSQYDADDMPVSWLGKTWTLRSAWIGEAFDVDFARNFNDQGDILLTFILVADGEIGPSVRDLIFAQGLNEQSAVASLIDSTKDGKLGQFLRTFEHIGNRNALFVWSPPSSTVHVAELVALFSYYSFALLMIWRVMREQSAISLLPDAFDFRARLEALLRLRLHIINIEQCLLTRNVSNDSQTQRAAASLKDKYGLRTKLESLLPLNEAIQRSLDTMAQLRADVHGSRLSSAAFVIAGTGLPLSLMSMLLAVDDTAPIVKRGISYLGDPSIAYFLMSGMVLALTLLSATFGLSIVTKSAARRYKGR